MDSHLEFIYVSEVSRQCRYALACFEAMKSAYKEDRVDDVFRNLDGLVGHAARLSLLFWPTQGDQDRGEYLRDLFGIKEDNVLANRGLRNDLQHFDERLDTWIKSTGGRRFIDSNISRPGDIDIDGEQPLRNFYWKECAYTFRSETYSIYPIALSIAEILREAEAKLSSRWIRGYCR